MYFLGIEYSLLDDNKAPVKTTPEQYLHNTRLQALLDTTCGGSHRTDGIIVARERRRSKLGLMAKDAHGTVYLKSWKGRVMPLHVT